jgi:hypothetical protein
MTPQPPEWTGEMRAVYREEWEAGAAWLANDGIATPLNLLMLDAYCWWFAKRRAIVEAATVAGQDNGAFAYALAQCDAAAEALHGPGFAPTWLDELRTRMDSAN